MSMYYLSIGGGVCLDATARSREVHKGKVFMQKAKIFPGIGYGKAWPA
jgi:hypothetical protein